MRSLRWSLSFSHRRVGPLLVSVLVLAGCTQEPPPRPPIGLVVGVGSTTEQRVLAALTVVTLEGAGIDATAEADLGGTAGLRRAALRGEIDLFWDYTGAAWSLGLGQQNPPAEPAESYERVREADLDNDLVWLEPTTANATLALFVRAQDLPPEPEPNGLEWLSGELSRGGAPLCVDPDFRDRAGGLAELATVYPMDLSRVDLVSASESAAVQRVADERCFAGLATATSGDAIRAGLVATADELGAFPAFIVAPVVREAALARFPGAREALGTVTPLLDTATLARLNAEAQALSNLEPLARQFLADVLPSEAPS